MAGTWLLAIGCLGVLYFTGPGELNAQREPRTSKQRVDEIVTIVVPATAPWTDTGIQLKIGDALEIRTWGRVTFSSSPGAVASPRGSGLPGGGCTFVVADAKVPAHSLVGNVAPSVSFDGHGFFVGSAWNGTAPIPGSTAPEGHLFLGFNDDGMIRDRSGYDSWNFTANNSGAFTAEVKVARRLAGLWGR